MKVAVLSGKGGTGKTFVSVNLAKAVPNSVYMDCDVEEPNGNLFFKAETGVTMEAVRLLPSFDAAKCTACKRCVEFCEFHALFYIKEKPKVFSEVCHSCGGCGIVCPEGAVTEIEKRIGVVTEGTVGDTVVITGILDVGEASGIPVIQKTIEQGKYKGDFQVIDCPPGSACSVMECVTAADYCILVTEPTVFGLHNLKMVYELTKMLQKPCGIVINKAEIKYKPLQTFIEDNGIPCLLELPFSKEIAKQLTNGELISEKNEKVKHLFLELYQKIAGGVSL